MNVTDQKQVEQLLDLENCDFENVAPLLAYLTPLTTPPLKAWLAATPKQYHNWLLDLAIRRDKQRNLSSRGSMDDFVGFVLATAHRSLAPDYDTARRGHDMSDDLDLQLLQQSRYNKFELLLTECIRQGSQPSKDRQREYAIRHLPYLLRDRDKGLDLLLPVLDEPPSAERHWAAIHLSVLAPGDPRVAAALLDSVMPGDAPAWKGPPELIDDFGQSQGRILLLLAFLTVCAPAMRGGDNQRKLLAKLSDAAQLYEPAKRVEAEAAVRELYRLLGRPAPQIDWKKNIPPYKQPKPKSTDGEPTAEQKERRREQLRAMFEMSWRPTCDALNIALRWYQIGRWPVDWGGDALWTWPPAWSGAQTTAEVVSDWKTCVQETISANERVLQPSDEYPPMLTQLDHVWIAFLEALANGVGVENKKLSNLAEITKNCGGMYMAGARVLLFERPQYHLVKTLVD